VDHGRYDEARVRFTAGLQIYRTLGVRTRLAGVLEGFAVLAAADDQARRALRLAGAAAALRDALMARPTPREAVWLRSRLVHARRQLGDDASDRAWADGLALSLEQAIDEALDAYPVVVAPVSAVHSSNGAAAPSNGALAAATRASTLAEMPDGTLVEPLTERQLEVAALVAGGLTNRQIGEVLVITEGTANLHVKHILRKLGFATRAQIASWATHQGLAVALALVAELR
jgi:DNA-binding NarL/FixJ family response regulator